VRREIPLAITFVVGMTILMSYFFAGTIPGTAWNLKNLAGDITGWGVLVSAFAVLLASVNLVRIHGAAISRKRKGWYNSGILIATMVAFALVGILRKHNPANTGINDLFQNMFNNVLSPLGAAMFALLAFYIASASYRAFRARSLEASILLAAAVLVMLGRAPIGELMWGQFPVISKWLLDIPNMAGQRAIMIGAAIGGFATSMRILLGLERGHLGGE